MKHKGQAMNLPLVFPMVASQHGIRYCWRPNKPEL